MITTHQRMNAFSFVIRAKNNVFEKCAENETTLLK